MFVLSYDLTPPSRPSCLAIFMKTILVIMVMFVLSCDLTPLSRLSCLAILSNSEVHGRNDHYEVIKTIL